MPSKPGRGLARMWHLLPARWVPRREVEPRLSKGTRPEEMAHLGQRSPAVRGRGLDYCGQRLRGQTGDHIKREVQPSSAHTWFPKVPPEEGAHLCPKESHLGLRHVEGIPCTAPSSTCPSCPPFLRVPWWDRGGGPGRRRRRERRAGFFTKQVPGPARRRGRRRPGVAARLRFGCPRAC